MAAYTKTTQGPPTGGFYTVGDTVTDSESTVWTCTKTGFAAPDGSRGDCASFAVYAAETGVVAGTATASKPLVTDTNKAVDVVRTASLRLGASGSEVAVTGTAAELNTLAAANAVLATTAAAGITGGAGAICKSAVERLGAIIKTTIILDLTGLGSSTTDLDIIGTGVSAAHIGRITAARNGTIFAGRVTCLKVPTTGVVDIDFYSANEATGKFDDGIVALTETALITAGGSWTLALTKALGAVPPANDYLYVCGGAAGTAGVYGAGQFLIELYGYDA